MNFAWGINIFYQMVVHMQRKRGIMKKPNVIKKFLRTLISIVPVLLLLAGCGTKNTTSDGKDMGDSLGWTYDIMGVRYVLYSNGYAEIDAILNPYCQLSETVTYEGKEYAVVKIVLHTLQSHGASYGIFGLNGMYEAPENLVIPNTIEEIPAYAFYGCTSSTITLPSNVKYVSGSAFSGCENIETIEFPDSLEKLCANGLFNGCTSLNHVELPDDVEYVTTTTERLFAVCSSLESAYIPGGCGGGRIGEYTFSDCESLTEITLGDGLTTVYQHAFHNLPLLEEIVFPDSITEIRDQTFYDCPNLKDVWLSDNLTDVPMHMFKQSYGNYDADTSGITIHVKESMVEYVQNLYPDATVIAK